MFFVLPSLAEGLPLVLLEAMASGLPVISSCNSAREVIVDWETGFIASPGNVSELRSRMNLLLDDETLRVKMARRARTVVEQKYDWRNVTSRILRVYEKTMNWS
jgi:glycosyltransferase involved in cell wall biosynthesis